MYKKIVSLFLCLLMVSSWNFTSLLAQEEASPSVQRKIVFFKDTSHAFQFEQRLRAISQEDILDVQVFPSLDSFSIPMTDKVKSLLLEYDRQIVLVEDITIKSYPIKTDYSSVLTDQSWNLEMTNAPQLWDKGYTGKGIKITVLDTGIDGSHEVFKDRIVDYAQFSRYGGIFRDDPKNSYDTDNHGTHVAGIAAGATADRVIGIAPQALLGSGIVIPGGMGSLSQIMGGLEWVLDPDGDPSTSDQPRIVNLSLGIPGYIKLWTPLFKKLLDSNILPVSAIGNDGDGVCGNPASTPNVLAVGAYNQKYHPASFSSGSDHLIWEDSYIRKNNFTKPDLSAPGVAIYSAIPGNLYARMSGTSMASPHIAGAAALLMEAFPFASAWDIWHYLVQGADDRGDPGPDSRFGAGSVNLLQSYELMKKSFRFKGYIQGDFERCELLNRSLDTPVYIDDEGRFSAYLLPGPYAFDLYYNESFIRTIQLTISQEDYDLDLRVPQATKTHFQGVVKDKSGKPLNAILRSMDQIWKTDENGRFSFEINSFEPVTIRSSGYIQQVIYPSQQSPYINVRLSRADLLLVEGYSYYVTTVNPPRRSHLFYLESLHRLGKKTAYLNAENETYTYEDIKEYPLIIYYCESGTLSLSEQLIYEKYIQQGGRVIFSGRMLLSLESYIRQSFLAKLFGISGVREFLTFPSVKGINELKDVSHMEFSLSGDTGANNQETCDIIPLPNIPPFIEPFLQFSETTGKRYAGLRKGDGLSKAVLLTFGIEGIGSPSQRTEFLRILLDWMDQSCTYEAQILEEGIFYLTITDKEEQSSKLRLDQGKIQLKNLLPERYTFLLEGFSYQPQTFEIDFSKHQYYYHRILPESSQRYDVNFIFDKKDLKQGFYRLGYKSEIIMDDTLDFDRVLNLKLPQGQYMLSIAAKNLVPLNKEFFVSDRDLIFEEELNISSKKILIIDDSKLEGYYRDANRVQEEYSKYLLAQKIGYDIWNVVPDGYPDNFYLMPYSLVLYLSGYNSYNSFGNEKIFDTLSTYLEDKGSITFFGLGAPMMLREQAFLKEYIGVSVLSSNTRERTVYSSGSSRFPEMRFDIYTSYSEGPARFPSFKPENPRVEALFYYINSSMISSTLHQQDHYKVLFFPFGMENIILPTVKDEFMKGVLAIFHDELNN